MDRFFPVRIPFWQTLLECPHVGQCLLTELPILPCNCYKCDSISDTMDFLSSFLIGGRIKSKSVCQMVMPLDDARLLNVPSRPSSLAWTMAANVHLRDSWLQHGHPKVVSGERFWLYSLDIELLEHSKLLDRHRSNNHVIACSINHDWEVPRAVQSDRDSKFMSEFWEGVFPKLGVTMLTSSIYHFQTDG